MMKNVPSEFALSKNQPVPYGICLYSRAVEGAGQQLDDEIWRTAAQARAESQTAWAVLKRHIAEHQCMDLTRQGPELATNDAPSPRVSPVGALIAELVNEVNNDPPLQILRADLYAASHSYETTEKKDLALRFFIATESCSTRTRAYESAERVRIGVSHAPSERLTAPRQRIPFTFQY
jgi:hypothetical protein